VTDQPQTVFEREGIRFEGDFRPPELAFLASQFGACRFRLAARSALRADVALVEWTAQSPADAGGPRPIRAMPRQATYVLAPAAAGMQLERVEDNADLATRFPGHFPQARVRQDWPDRLRRAIRSVWPALMLAVATVWVLATVWTCRPVG
jgi:hypothetical protein